MCKESSETTESRMKIPCEGALNGLTRQKIASKRAPGDFSGATYTHTHKPHSKVSRLFLVENTFALGRAPVLSAAYGSLRSCECLRESKFVKRDEVV